MRLISFVSIKCYMITDFLILQKLFCFFFSGTTACLPGWKHNKDLTEVLGTGMYIKLYLLLAKNNNTHLIIYVCCYLLNHAYNNRCSTRWR